MAESAIVGATDTAAVSPGSAVTYYGNYGCSAAATVQSLTSVAQASIVHRGSSATLQNLRARITTNGRAATSTLTTFKNGSATAQTLSIPASTTGTFSDLANTVSLTAGDSYSYEIAIGSTSGAFLLCGISAELVSSGQSQSPLSALGSISLTTGSVTRYLPLAGRLAIYHSSEAQAQVRSPVAGTLSNMRVYASAARATATTVRSRINGADGNQTVSVTGTGAFEDTSNTDTLAVGDDFCISVATGTGSDTLTLTSASAIATPSTAKQSVIATAYSGNATAGGTKYFHVLGRLAQNASESVEQIVAPFSGTLSNLNLNVESNASTVTTTVTTRVGGAGTALTLSVSAGATGKFSNTSDSATVAAGDLLSVAVAGHDGTFTMNSMAHRFTAAGIITGAGAVSTDDVTVSGTGLVADAITGTGAVALDDATLAATGTLEAFSAHGAVTLDDITVAGAGEITGEGRPAVVRNPLIAIEITAAVDAAGTLQTFYVSDAPFITEPTDTPANIAFDPGLTDPGSIGISAFGDARTGGSTRLSLGEVRIANADGRYDGWLNYGFDGRPIVIRRGGTGAYPAEFTEVFSGTMAGTPLVTRQEVVIRLRDRQYIFDRPALSVTYAGDNDLPDGLEGTETDIKGQVKPRLFGKVLNIAPPLVNTSKLTYQISNGGIASVDAVYDRGAPITAGPDYSTASLLQAATVAGGTYATCISAGLFRLGSEPAGQVTCDATQGGSAEARSAASLLKLLAMEAGVAEADIFADDVLALDSANPSPLGLWLNTDETFASAMDRIAGSVGAYYTFDPVGRFRMGRLTAPEGQPELTIADYDSFDPFERRPAKDGDLPVWRVTVRHSRNWTVQTGDLAGSVSMERKAALAGEWRSSVAEDPSIKDKHPLAEEWVVDTLLTSAAEAQTEAERLLALYGQRTDFFDVTVRADFFSASSAWLMSSTALTNPRFGLEDGRLFRLLGVKPELKTGKATLSLWGPPTEVPPLPPPPPPPPPLWPRTPLFLLDPETGDGRGVPNTTAGGGSIGTNIFSWAKADIRNNGSATLPVVTRFSSGTNARLLWTGTSNTFSFWGAATNAIPPAGVYTARVKLTSNTGGDVAMRIGSVSSPTDVSAITVTTTPTVFTKEITTDGTNYATFGLYNDGAGNLPDVLIDEIEVYLSADLPASFNDARNWGFRRRANLLGRTLYAADGSLDNTQNAGTVSAGAFGLIQAPEALTVTADTEGYQLTEWTYLLICSASAAAAANNILLASETNANLGSTGNSLQFGIAQTTGRPATQPLNFGVAELQTVGTGYHIFGARTKNLERAVNYGRVMMSWDDNAYSGFKVRTFLHGGTATTTQYNGKEALLVFWDHYLTDAEWAQAVTRAEYLMSQRGLTVSKRAWGYIGAGDSITAGPSISTSYASLQGIGFNFDGSTYNLPTRNVGVSGYGISDIEAMLEGNNAATSFAVGPGGIVARIEEMLADDMQPVVSLMIGVNDSGWINTNGVAAFYTRLKAVWATLRAAGAKVIGVTNLPANVGNNWEANRLELRTNILADAASLLDGVADFGDPSSYMGDEANLGDTTYWNVDQLHPVALGHSTYLAPTMKAAIISVGVPA